MFSVPQYCLCSPVPLKIWPLFPCSPEINALFPLLPKPLGGHQWTRPDAYKRLWGLGGEQCCGGLGGEQGEYLELGRGKCASLYTGSSV